VANHSTSSAGFKTGPTGHARSDNGDRVEPEEPIYVLYKPFALAVARLIGGFKVAAKTWEALKNADPPEWSDLADHIRESGGLTTPKQRADAAVRFLKGLDGRRPAAMVKVIRAALKWAMEQEGLGDEPEEPDGPPPFSLNLIGSAEFFSQDYPLDWIVKGVTVANDPGTIGGPSKALKTSILIDKGISIGTATPFLGRFEVPRARRVALISGESGRRVIQSSARQVCLARGLTAQDLGMIHWGFSLPQLTSAEHLRVLRKTIEDNGIEYLALDPFYLMLMAGSAGVDPKSMFEMGPILADVARLCVDAGCTLELAHHFVKKRDDPFGSPDLSELAYSGMGQFVRQWMLVAPRERFDAEIGLFKLHFAYGGSAGHCGEFAVDIEVGKLDPDMDRRCWKVTINTPSEVRNARQEQRQAETTRKRAEKDQADAVERNRKEREAMCDALDIFRKTERHRLTSRALRTAAGWGAEKADRILFLLKEAGSVRACSFAVKIGSGAEKLCDGFELVQDPEGGA
jgi:replicative DNA helicase